MLASIAQRAIRYCIRHRDHRGRQASGTSRLKASGTTRLTACCMARRHPRKMPRIQGCRSHNAATGGCRRGHSGVQDESVPGSRTTGIRYATPGSAQHEAGLCRPCLWFTTERGCVYGADRCNNCHFEHPGRAKPSKSKRDNIRRRAAILAEKEKAAAAAAAAKPEAAAAAAQYAAPASSAPAAAGVAPRDSTKKTAVPTRISL
eukprot:gnl/TRDRNA2_/TRDRNA2_176829_c3_seq8.p1 gnl/TRDRNA2_/TRDRNA2_176829_c3~~gnl/TRDRNA2_/TRDRNA2_176829_c3_seq8.p1  ORF type:complete len:204 (+),score=16.08 gnl/TRDRNA2_/TRDRNA2_176829_c3_seq8:346-957(+)